MYHYFKTLLFFCLIGSLQAQDGDLNMKIVAHVPAPEGGSGIWHFVDRNGLEYAAIGTRSALVVYSLEDPSKPIERARVKGVNTTWREVYAYKDYIYGVTDQASDGVIIINMKKAPDTITSKFWSINLTANGQTADIKNCHTVFVDEKGILCLNGCSPWQGVLFFDLNQDPEEPKFLGAETKRYCHDMYMRNDTMWSSDIYQGIVSVWDVRDKADPKEITTISTPFSFTHNDWLSDDGKYIFTTDERENAFVASFDVSDLSNVKLLDTWRPKDTEGTGVIPHNTRYLDGFLITAYYTDGIKIIDAHRPENLIEVGSVDTYFGAQTGFHGCWGVSPYLPSKTIVASDIEGGLFVIQPEYIRACYLEGKVTDSLTNEAISKVNVHIRASRTNLEETNLKGEYKTGYAVSGSYEVEFNHPDYIPATLTVDLENGVLKILDIKLLKRGSITQRIVVREKGSNQEIEGAQIVLINSTRSIESVTGTDGSASMIILQDQEPYELIVGKWGYKHHGEVYNSLSPVPELVILVEKGYQDDFVFNLGWTVNSTANAGIWVRDEPVGTVSGRMQMQTNKDVDSDFGQQCFVTGNNGTDPSQDDVDGGYTRLTSPAMDLSRYNEPLMSYAYWFTNAGGNNTPNDTLSVYLLSGTDTILLQDVFRSDTSWRKTVRLKVKDFVTDLSDLRVMVDVADSNPGHLVEGAFDEFLVIDGNPVKTERAENRLYARVFPNLFSNETRVYLDEPVSPHLEIAIYSVEGRLMESISNPSKSNVLTLGSKLKPGMYILRIQDPLQGENSFKLIKQ
ncbi:MAG TPA: choice-of-anchor B family protein [Saprospiraceae bacterium]|nr:choice-of-anchor B family protein [Saprospiraceae bacterium]